jgi:hypothetical protein
MNHVLFLIGDESVALCFVRMRMPALVFKQWLGKPYSIRPRKLAAEPKKA